jgi:DNA-binding GntR family transcriptional regulator
MNPMREGLQAGRGGESAGASLSAYERIVAALLSGDLARGGALTDVGVAAVLGIGRTPVHEALCQLEFEGLIRRRLGDSFVVAELDQGETVDLYAVRERLEGMAASLAAQHATPEENAVLRRMCMEHGDACRESDDLSTHKRLNAQFHRQICRMSRNGFVTRALDSLRITLALGTTLSAPGRLESAIAEHEELVDVIARQDVVKAEAVARRHVRTALRARLEQSD